TDDEIKKMREEAERNAEEDKKAKEEIDKLNAADALIFSTEKQLNEYGDKISADKKAPIEGALKKLKDAHASKNFADLDSAQTELQNAWNAASEEMYKATQENAAQGGAETGNAEGQAADAGDQVTDVDFEEVKEDDKKKSRSNERLFLFLNYFQYRLIV